MAERILALEEPWRERFVAYVAGEAGRGPDDGALSQKELEACLRENRRLGRRVAEMLRAWTKEAR